MPVWLDKSTELPVTELTTDALLDEWADHRNDLRGYMAAEEVMKRLYATRIGSPDAISGLLSVRWMHPSSGTQQG